MAAWVLPPKRIPNLIKRELMMEGGQGGWDAYLQMAMDPVMSSSFLGPSIWGNAGKSAPWSDAWPCSQMRPENVIFLSGDEGQGGATDRLAQRHPAS